MNTQAVSDRVRLRLASEGYVAASKSVIATFLDVFQPGATVQWVVMRGNVAHVQTGTVERVLGRHSIGSLRIEAENNRTGKRVQIPWEAVVIDG